MSDQYLNPQGVSDLWSKVKSDLVGGTTIKIVSKSEYDNMSEADKNKDIIYGVPSTGTPIPGVNWSNPNLLDNWYFLNAIDQRKHNFNEIFSTTSSIFIDRWRLVSGTVKKTTSGLVLNGTIRQVSEQDFPEKFTATVLTTKGPIVPSVSGKNFDITASGETLIAAKMEVGNAQTLYSEDGKLFDAPPNYPTELLKCQRYFYRLKTTYYAGIFVSSIYKDRNVTDGIVYFPTTMRDTPTVLLPDGFEISYYDSSTSTTHTTSGSTVTRFGGDGSRLILRITLKGASLPNGTAVWVNSNTGYIDFSAEL